ncbi:MAG: hypothetical protein L6V91_02855 [Bacilli bacterium]|nr:MAG: hypothetical protein L6V91_02855 [Bacilli bacterium]
MLLLKIFTNKLANEEDDDNYEIISLDKITSIQIIDEKLCNFDVDINKLYDITIPKPEVKKEEVPPKKRVEVLLLCFLLFLF